MKIINCNLSIKDFYMLHDFIGCDGKPWSNDLLESNMHSASEREDYNFAAKCRDELKRRKNE